MAGFEIRPITDPKDLLRHKKLCVYLYRAPNAGLADEDAVIRTAMEDRANAPEDDILLGAYEDGVLYSSLRLRPYTVNFDGHDVAMSGIGGVISDPAVQGKGAVKQLFAEAFRLMHEQGRALSQLYPFDTWYYRQFGYDACCGNTEWSIPVRQFRTTGEGRFRAFDNSPEMKNQIREIYASFCRRFNMCVIRTESEWDQFFAKHDAYTSGLLSFVHETDGKADAFMSVSTQSYPDKALDFQVPCLWFSSMTGLREIFAYFKTQIPFADRALVTLPQGIDLSGIIGISDGWGKRNSRMKFGFTGLSRAVDVQALLAVAKVRHVAEGNVTIRISGDSYCPWNNGVYTLSLEDPSRVTKAEDHGQECDIDLTPNTFVSLFFGRYDMDTCDMLPDVRVNGDRAKLSEIFYPKPCFIDARF